MKLLAYGIVRDGTQVHAVPANGVDGKPVLFTAAAGLAAPFSTVAESLMVPDTSRALAYARVVETFHRHESILPLRYGAFFDSEGALADLLCRRQIEFLAALDRVTGLTEMGIRVLVPEAHGLPSVGLEFTTGVDYLARRRNIYRTRDAHRNQEDQIILRLRAYLEGLYADFAAEVSAGDKGLPSLFFLISRDQVDPFSQRIRRLQENSQEKMYLTGPWPPYNFVRCGNLSHSGNRFPGNFLFPNRRI